jgi:hypothetical protein
MEQSQNVAPYNLFRVIAMEATPQNSNLMALMLPKYEAP